MKTFFQIANIFFRVTRTLFIFAELTNLDPRYTGPVFNFDAIIRELVAQVGERESGRLVICKRTQLLRKALFCNTLPATARSPPFCIPAVVNTIRSVHVWLILLMLVYGIVPQLFLPQYTLLIGQQMVRDALLAPRLGRKVLHKQNFGIKWLWDPTTRGATPHHEGRHPPPKEYR